MLLFVSTAFAQTKINEALQAAYELEEDKETVFGLGMEVKF